MHQTKCINSAHTKCNNDKCSDLDSDCYAGSGEDQFSCADGFKPRPSYPVYDSWRDGSFATEYTCCPPGADSPDAAGCDSSKCTSRDGDCFVGKLPNDYNSSADQFLCAGTLVPFPKGKVRDYSCAFPSNVSGQWSGAAASYADLHTESPTFTECPNGAPPPDWDYYNRRQFNWTCGCSASNSSSSSTTVYSQQLNQAFCGTCRLGLSWDSSAASAGRTSEICHGCPNGKTLRSYYTIGASVKGCYGCGDDSGWDVRLSTTPTCNLEMDAGLANYEAPFTELPITTPCPGSDSDYSSCGCDRVSQVSTPPLIVMCTHHMPL